MKMKNLSLAKLGLLMICSVFASVTIHAQDREDERDERDNQKTKQAQAVSKEVYDRIQSAQELIDADRQKEALDVLNGLKTKKGLTEYELQNVLNYIGFVHYNMDNVNGALQAYEELLRIPSVEEQIRKQTLYTMAQLTTMQENYTKALGLLDQWFALESNPGPEPYILYAQNLYQVNRYPDMIKPIETAMGIATSRDTAIKEDWYVLLNFAYFQQENYKKVRDIQKILLASWPKKAYWFSLAGAYTELGEDDNLMAAYEAAHTQGLLEKESELSTMAQLYMQHKVPWKAATLLDAEMKGGRMAKNDKNYRMLSQALTLAAEDEMAIPALQEAARLSDEGELDLRLGNAYLNLGKYGECVSAIKKGIEKGKIKSPDNAHISMGMCQYNEADYRDAIASFRKAAETQRSRRISNQWISVIESDIERNEQIRLAEVAAQRQIRELEERRKAAKRI